MLGGPRLGNVERTDFEQWSAKEVARLLALVETERRYYQEMVASLPVALVVLSADLSMVSANRAFRQLFGLRTRGSTPQSYRAGSSVGSSHRKDSWRARPGAWATA